MILKPIFFSRTPRSCARISRSRWELSVVASWADHHVHAPDRGNLCGPRLASTALRRHPVRRHRRAARPIGRTPASVPASQWRGERTPPPPVSPSTRLVPSRVQGGKKMSCSSCCAAAAVPSPPVVLARPRVSAPPPPLCSSLLRRLSRRVVRPVRVEFRCLVETQVPIR